MKSSKQVGPAKSRSSRIAAQTRREAGAAAVEMALVLPILMLLVFGIVNYGFIFAAQISLNSAARDAARAGVVKPLTSTGTAKICSQIAIDARTYAKTIGVNPTSIRVEVAGPAGTCTLDYGATSVAGSVTGSAAALTICTQPISPPTPPLTQLTVVLRYTAVAPVPYVPPSSSALSATGVFECEYV